MADRDELVAEVEVVLARLVDDGHLEVASRRSAASLAAPLLALLEDNPNADIGEWLMERGEVSELYVDPSELPARFGTVFTRLANEDKPPLHDPALVAILERNPDDEKAWLVYADWLADRGDPRGELIVLQTRRAHETAPDALARLDAGETSLFARRRTHFFGDLPPDDDERLTVTFRHGFFDGAKLKTSVDLEDLLAIESSRFLRSLVVDDILHLPTALAKHALPRSLTSATLGRREPAGVDVIDLAALTRDLPRLARFSIRAHTIHVGRLDLPALEALTLRCKTLTFADDHALALPALRSLALDVDDTEIPVPTGDAIRALFHAPPPNLTELKISRPFVVSLCASPLPRQLVTLDLSNGAYYGNDTNGRALAESRAAFGKLETLDLRGCWLDAADRTLLEGAYPMALFGNAPPNDDDLDEDEYDEDDDGYGGQGEDDYDESIEVVTRDPQEDAASYEEPAYDDDDSTADDGTISDDTAEKDDDKDEDDAPPDSELEP